MYTPIASKSFGTDTETGLEKQILIWQQTNDAKNETITVYYDIVLISPTGKIVSVLMTDAYVRYNQSVNRKFDVLRASSIGQGIIALIENDLNMIQGFDTLKSDLVQLNVAPE